jgi:hypothetical protein
VEELGPGLYERLLTEGLKAQLDELAESIPTEQRALRAAEAQTASRSPIRTANAIALPSHPTPRLRDL